MKIRTDFVTNSSSSSYITYRIDITALEEVLQKNGMPSFTEKEGIIGTELEDGILSFATDMDGIDAWPDNIGQLLVLAYFDENEDFDYDVPYWFELENIDSEHPKETASYKGYEPENCFDGSEESAAGLLCEYFVNTDLRNNLLVKEYTYEIGGGEVDAPYEEAYEDGKLCRYTQYAFGSGFSIEDSKEEMIDEMIIYENGRLDLSNAENDEYQKELQGVQYEILRFSDTEKTKGLESLGKVSCNAVEKLILPANIKELGYRVFVGSNNLRQIELSPNIKTIPEKAFMDCVSLKTVIIPEGIEEIGPYAFEGCSEIEELILPASISKIGDYAFLDCISLKKLVFLGNFPDDIGFSVCRNCISLMEAPAILLDTVGCSRIQALSAAEENGFLTSDSDGLLIRSGMLEKYTGENADVVIPKGVKRIGHSAFQECENIASVVIPEGLLSIGDYAFSGCEGLINIIIPSSVNIIGKSAFNECISLTSFTIPDGVASIEDSAFSQCYALKQVTVPDSVLSIGKEAFLRCGQLSAITIPEYIKSIGESAFWSCTSLSTITIPRGVERIGNWAFSDCVNLSVNYQGTIAEWCKIQSGIMWDERSAVKLIIQSPELNEICEKDLENVEVIKDFAFDGCEDLTKVRIPESVTSIGTGAFHNCRNLTSVTILGNLNQIGFGAFINCANLSDVNILGHVESIGERMFKGCKSLTHLNAPNLTQEQIDALMKEAQA